LACIGVRISPALACTVLLRPSTACCACSDAVWGAAAAPGTVVVVLGPTSAGESPGTGAALASFSDAESVAAAPCGVCSVCCVMAAGCGGGGGGAWRVICAPSEWSSEAR
jgi:hypothetical protein